MQQFDNSSASDGTIVLPRYAINMARRVMQLMSTADTVHIQVIRLNDLLYLVLPDNTLERL
jgi:hypothetical protein